MNAALLLVLDRRQARRSTQSLAVHLHRGHSVCSFENTLTEGSAADSTGGAEARLGSLSANRRCFPLAAVACAAPLHYMRRSQDAHTKPLAPIYTCKPCCSQAMTFRLDLAALTKPLLEP